MSKWLRVNTSFGEFFLSLDRIDSFEIIPQWCKDAPSGVQIRYSNNNLPLTIEVFKTREDAIEFVKNLLVGQEIVELATKKEEVAEQKKE